MAHLQHISTLVIMIIISDCTESPTTIVIATVEEDVVLPCFTPAFLDPESCYRVKWTKHATAHSTQLKVILARPETSKFQDAERVTWEADGKGGMSLSLTRVAQSDAGVYSCEVWRGWDCILVQNISLKVKACKALKPVKAAPSSPATLHCPMDTSGQHHPQNVSWAMMKGGIENPEFQYHNITQSRESLQPAGASLTIPAVNFSDSGWYRCTYLVGQSQRCFEIKLQVQVEDALVTSDPAVTTDLVITTDVAVTTTKGVQVTTTEIVLKNGRGSGTSTIVVASVIPVITIIAALIVGTVIYCRRYTQRQQRDTGVRMQPNDGYESVYFPVSDVATRVNSLYTNFQEGDISTFQCE